MKHSLAVGGYKRIFSFFLPPSFPPHTTTTMTMATTGAFFEPKLLEKFRRAIMHAFASGWKFLPVEAKHQIFNS
jgi:hypothetical protein